MQLDTSTPQYPVDAWISYVLPPATLAAWGVVMLHTFATGRAKSLLHPLFQPIIAIAGVLLLALAFAHLFYFLPRAGRRDWFHWFLLLAPVLAAAATAPGSFSAQMIAARGIQTSALTLDSGATDASAEKMLQTLTDADPAKPLPMGVSDLVSISGVPAVAQKLQGRTLRLRGQYYRVNGSDFKLLQLVMYCCAADATPIGVLVHGQAPAGLANMDWVEIEGPVQFIQSLGQIHPEIGATSVQKVPAPANPYAY